MPPGPQPTIVSPPPTFDTQSIRAPSEESHAQSSIRPNQPRKLRKARKDDGYDSDGGYLSDSSKKKKKSKDRKNAGSSSHEADFTSDGGYLSDATKKTSDKKKDKKGNKVTDGYVTDSSKTHHKLTKKSRPHLDDAEFSDGGYLSEVSVKKKKTFFRRLGSRSQPTSQKGGLSSESLPPPPVPALPPQQLPIAERFSRSPVPFEHPDGSLTSATPSIRTAYSPVPPSVDESVTTLTSAFGRTWSPPPPPSDSVMTATRPPSADLSLENWTSSSASHGVNQFSPVSPVMQSWEALPHVPPRAQSREAEGRSLSPGSSHEQLSAAHATSRPHGVRFTPSTRFSPSDSTFPIPPSPSEVSVAPDKRHQRPKISLPNTSALNLDPPSASPSPLHSILRNATPISSPSDSRPFLSPAPRSRMTPSPNPPFLRGVSPSLSDLSIISSSEFIVPSPRPRFLDDLPPPSPPPTGPLPEVPSSGGLYSQPIPSIKRGREPPFPARGVLPAEQASRIIESTLRARREALLARLADSEAEAHAVETGHGGIGNGGNEFDVGIDDNIVPDMQWLAEAASIPPPSPPPPEQQREEEQDWPDDESVRPDIAQFYLYEPSGNGGGARDRDVIAGRRRSPDAPHDERSTYTYSYATSTAGDARGDIESYYFGVPDPANEGNADDVVDDSTEAQSRASFVDDERSQGMRARLIARVDALYGAEQFPPVPKLRPF